MTKNSGKEDLNKNTRLILWICCMVLSTRF